MSDRFYSKGKQAAVLGLEADEAGRKSDALIAYTAAAEYLITGLTHEKNAAAKAKAITFTKSIMARAEGLKTELAASKKTSASNTPGVVRKAPPDEETLDPERKAIRDGLMNSILEPGDLGVAWEDVKGIAGAKRSLEEAIVMPTKFPQLFTGKRQPWQAILMYGPPGTGKSFLAQASAGLGGSTFFSVSAADLTSKWMGQGERQLRELFTLAQERAPSIIFIDEIDSLAGQRRDDEKDAERRLKTELLVRMTEVASAKGVLILGATNRPWDLDPAVRRRFNKRIYIPLPDKEARLAMLKAQGAKEAPKITEAQWNEFADMTDGLSGADLVIAVRDALMAPVRRLMKAKHFRKNPLTGTYYACESNSIGAREMSLWDIDPTKLAVPETSYADFKDKLAAAKSSVNAEELVEHLAWSAKYGESGDKTLDESDLWDDEDAAAAPALPPAPGSPRGIDAAPSPPQAPVDNSSSSSSSRRKSPPKDSGNGSTGLKAMLGY